MNRQLLSRAEGEGRAERAMLQLLCAVSVWRTAETMIVPLCGTSAWWTTMLCLIPGFAAAFLLRLAMALTRTSTLLDAVRACLGRVGAAAFSLLLTALLLVEAVTTLTALLTVFTQGVGTRGTQFTLAVLTGAVMLFSLHREGLPRAVYFLRWGMIAAVVVVAVCALSHAKLDHLFPLHGAGNTSCLTAVMSASSLAWPVTLLLTIPSTGRRGRLCSAVLPSACAIAGLGVSALMIPHEMMICRTQLADTLLLPAWYLPNALRLLWLCLLMLVFFLGIASSVQLATRHLLAPFAKVPGWLPHALLIGVALTQLDDPQCLWTLLTAVQPWLFLILAGAALIILPIAFIRRKRA